MKTLISKVLLAAVFASNHAAALDSLNISDVDEVITKGSVLKCMGCSTVMNAVDWLFNTKTFQSALLDIAIDACILGRLATTPREICPQIVP